MEQSKLNLIGQVFGKEVVKNLKESKCPFCGHDVKEDEFRDNLSKREFQISGLCQSCQDKTFGK